MNCKFCGAELQPDAIFCGECGHRIEDKQKYCPACGVAVKEGQRFCQKCGTKLDEAPMQASRGGIAAKYDPEKHGRIFAGDGFSAAVTKDGRLRCAGDASACLAIESLCGPDTVYITKSTRRCLYALEKSGTVNMLDRENRKHCLGPRWTNIRAFTTVTFNHDPIGLNNGGEMVIDEATAKFLRFKAQEWKGVTAVTSGISHIVGLKKDGTAVAAGDCFYGKCNVAGWTNLVAVSATWDNTFGVTSDGTVVWTGKLIENARFTNWENIVAFEANEEYVVGLKADGTVVAERYAFSNDYLSACRNWKNIIAISLGSDRVLGLKEDGTVVIAGYTEAIVSQAAWKLF